MLYIYNQYLKGESKEKIAELVEQLPTNDFKIAAIEYFSRTYAQNDLIKLSDKESEFFNYFWRCHSMNQSTVSENVYVK
ncbi:hypothetical protein D3C76_1686760 [compost metagenome]